MLGVVQFPIADVRSFTPYGTWKLDVPDAPPKTSINPQFVRYFGSAVDRRRGADTAWVDESAFCHARQALQFVGLKRQALNVQGNAVKGGFRRLLSDGEAVVRVEAGLICWRDTRPEDEEDEASTRRRRALPPQIQTPQDFLTMAHRLLHLRTRVTGLGSVAERELLLQGKHLADLYNRATERQQTPSEVRPLLSSLVEPGSPLLIVELSDAETEGWSQTNVKSAGLRVVDARAVRGAFLAFGQVSTRWGNVETWFIGPSGWHFGWSKWGADSYDQNNIRSLRLCLLRLHAETQVLDLVLKQFQRGRIVLEPGTAYSSRLERYLNTATRLINREHLYGVGKSAILEAYSAMQSVQRSDVQASLGLRYQGIRRQVYEKVKEYQESRKSVASTFIWIGDQVGDTFNFSGSFWGTVIGKQAATTITNSLNTFDRSPNAGDVDLKQAIISLHNNVTELIKRMADNGVGDPEEVANQLATFTAQASNKKPLRDVLKATAQGLVDATKMFADIAGPIATAVSVVLKVFGIPTP